MLGPENITQATLNVLTTLYLYFVLFYPHTYTCTHIHLRGAKMDLGGVCGRGNEKDWKEEREGNKLWIYITINFFKKTTKVIINFHRK